MTEEQTYDINFVGSIAESSVFDKRTLDDIYDEIIRVYQYDDRPWVLGYSGGKDSTTALQLIWTAMQRLQQEDPGALSKTVYVIASDTLVETPAVVNHLDKNLDMMRDTATRAGLPFKIHKVEPDTNDTFWVNLIGRGYPAPTSSFRWCTDRMKIRPATDFIIDKADKFGEVVVVLGVRKQESATRAQVMSLHEKPGSELKTHSSIPAAFVYTPIEDFSIDDVWTYLISNESPWGFNNRNLVAMYREADGECPLVIDKTTPTCGNSRFGCWTCTVVSEDKSMQAMIESGSDWMEPMLEFRNFLAKTQDPSRKLEYRSHKRKNGRITKKRESSKSKPTEDEAEIDVHSVIVPGPYEMWFRKELLEKLLRTQEEVRELGPDPNYTLIYRRELLAIRRLWIYEDQDWEDSVPKIYKKVTGESLEIGKDDVGMFDTRDLELLAELCEDEDIQLEMLVKLLTIERSMYGMLVRPNVHNKIEKVLREDWFSKDFILDEIKKGEQIDDILVNDYDI